MGSKANRVKVPSSMTCVKRSWKRWVLKISKLMTIKSTGSFCQSRWLYKNWWASLRRTKNFIKHAVWLWIASLKIQPPRFSILTFWREGIWMPRRPILWSKSTSRPGISRVKSITIESFLKLKKWTNRAGALWKFSISSKETLTKRTKTFQGSDYKKKTIKTN